MTFRDMTPAETSARVIAIVEKYVWPEERREAATAITDLLIDVQQAIAGAALQAYREGAQAARDEVRNVNARIVS